MAAPAVTPAQVQAALGTDQGSPKILRAEQTVAATTAMYLVQAGAGGDGNGRTYWVQTTNTDTAANQATSINNALKAIL